ATDAIVNAMQDEGLVLKGFERGEALGEFEVTPRGFRPEGIGHYPVGAEEDHQPLPPLGEAGKPQALRVHDKRGDGRADSQVTQELAAGSIVTHGVLGWDDVVGESGGEGGTGWEPSLGVGLSIASLAGSCNYNFDRQGTQIVFRLGPPLAKAI